MGQGCQIYILEDSWHPWYQSRWPSDPSLPFPIASKDGLFTYKCWQRWMQTGPKRARDARYLMWKTPGNPGVWFSQLSFCTWKYTRVQYNHNLDHYNPLTSLCIWENQICTFGCTFRPKKCKLNQDSPGSTEKVHFWQYCRLHFGVYFQVYFRVYFRVQNES